MKEILKIQDFAEIRPGYPFRRKINTDPNGDVLLVQMKNISNQGKVELSHLEKINSNKKDPVFGIEFKNFRHFLDIGDILFKAKGRNNNAGVLDKKIEPAVASQQFIVIKIEAPNIIPHYVASYLNHLNAIGYFEKENEGTYIPFVSKRTVSQVRVPIPSLKAQEKIVRLNQLVHHEAELLDQIKEKRKNLTRMFMEQYLSYQQ